MRAAEAALSVVVTPTRAASCALERKPIVEPWLKPYQPIHRKKVPLTVRGTEWPTRPHDCRLESLLKRPMRGPRTAEPIRAAKPPVMCTTPEPAKSIIPHSQRV